MSKFNLNRAKNPDGVWSEEFGKKVFNAKRAQSLAALPPPPPPPRPSQNSSAPVTVPAPALMIKEDALPLVRCDSCGAAVWKDRVVEHEEWHETMTQAIREQVEEAMSQQRRDIEDFNRVLAETMTPADPKMFIPSSKMIVDPTDFKYAVLGECPHGVNLDRAICQNGCRV